MVTRLRIQQASFLEWLHRTRSVSLSRSQKRMVYNAIQTGTYLNNIRESEKFNFLRIIYLDEYKNSLL